MLMRIIILYLFSIVSSAALAISAELLPENLPSANIKFIFDRDITLSKKNNYRLPIIIDSNNRCVLTSPTPTVKKRIFIEQNTEWKSETNSYWNDWDSKSFSFKMSHRSGVFLLKCELNLGGEVLLFNADQNKKSVTKCSRQGGRIQGALPIYSQNKSQTQRSPTSTSKYCVKKIPRVKVSSFVKAFEKSKIFVAFDFPAEPPVAPPITAPVDDF